MKPVKPKSCRVCRNDFTPRNSLQVICTKLQCAVDYGKESAARARTVPAAIWWPWSQWSLHMNDYSAICWHGWKTQAHWGFWFRILGYGLAISTMEPLFSERIGKRKTLRIFGVKFEWLTP